MESAKNVEAACTGFMKVDIKGKPKDICSVIRSKCLGGIKKNDLKTQLQKILATGKDKTISLSKFNKIAEYFKNSSWPDNNSEKNELQQQAQQGGALPPPPTVTRQQTRTISPPPPIQTSEGRHSMPPPPAATRTTLPPPSSRPPASPPGNGKSGPQ